MHIGFEFELHFNQARGYVVARLMGDIDYESELALFDKIVNHPEYTPGMNRIWDYSEANLFNLNQEEIWMLANYSRVFPKGIHEVRVAFVTAKDLNMGVIMLFTELAREKHAEVEAFSSLKEAEQWIARDSKEEGTG